jgi:hypothetical protein
MPQQTNVPGVSFSFGQAPLPDLGTFSYNGITFGPLLTSKITGTEIKDEAGWTVKWVEYKVELDGWVTLELNQETTDPTMQNIRQLLSAYAGNLTYTGRGFGDNFDINSADGGSVRDMNWGPKPEVLEFVPLGGGRAAKVHWVCTTCIPELHNPPAQAIGPGLGSQTKVAQFNEEIIIRFNDDQYSSIEINGTLEIGLTRPLPPTKTLTDIVDAYRQKFLPNALVDETRWKVTEREFHSSRDMRTMQWRFAAQELAPMGIPPWAVDASGNFTVRQLHGMVAANILWLCGLRCTYTIRPDYPMRTAWFHFLLLTKFRMNCWQYGNIQTPPRPIPSLPAPGQLPTIQPNTPQGHRRFFSNAFATVKKNTPTPANAGLGPDTKAIPLMLDFGLEEGLYKESKTITFHCAWRLATTFSHIIYATGIWRWQKGTTGKGSGIAGIEAVGTPGPGDGSQWAMSMADITGWKSWMDCSINPASVAIVDFGG